MIHLFLVEILRLLGEMAPYLILGFILAGLLHAFVPKKAVVKHLGRESVGSAFKATLIGVPMPLCSCGVIPTGIGLLKRGASRAATVAFLISTPQTGLDSIAVTYGFFGWLFAIFRPAAAFLSGILGGIATLFIRQPAAAETHWLKYHVKGEDALEEEGRRGFTRKLTDGMRFAFIELLGDIAFWLVVGLVVATLISMAIPDDFFGDKLGRGLPQMLVMMLFGIPLYVCSTASVPIAAVLMAKGISAGAAFVFLVTGPATNAATMLIIGRVMGWRVLAVYLGSIVLLALGFGLGLDGLARTTGIEIAPTMVHEHGLNPYITWGSAGVLTFFVVLHFFRKLDRRMARRGVSEESKGRMMDIKIDGMHCSHCEKTVTQAIMNVPGVTDADVSLDTGQAHIEGENLDRTAVQKAIEAVGYTVMSEE